MGLSARNLLMARREAHLLPKIPLLSAFPEVLL